MKWPFSLPCVAVMMTMTNSTNLARRSTNISTSTNTNTRRITVRAGMGKRRREKKGTSLLQRNASIRSTKSTGSELAQVRTRAGRR